MGSSFTNINLHIIFHVGNTSVAMRDSDMPQIFQYIGGIIRELGGYAYMVGGQPDHIHILTSLPIKLNIPDFVRLIKTNSSKWLKQLHSEYKVFSWQEGYGAFSVSESNKKAVIHYILNQKEHHKVRTAHDEWMMFLDKNGFYMDETTGRILKRGAN